MPTPPRRVLVATLGLLVACGGSAPPAPPRAADTLAFLVGGWSHDDGTTVVTERWRAAPDGDLLGHGTVRMGRVTGFSETLHVTRIDGALVYTAWPADQDPVAFRGSAEGADRVTFRNADHDFPREITYRREAEVLHVRATGVRDGAEHEETWTLGATE